MGELIFQIRDIETEKIVGIVKKERNFSCQFEACSNSTLYFIDFPMGSSPFHKLLIIAAV